MPMELTALLKNHVPKTQYQLPPPPQTKSSPSGLHTGHEAATPISSFLTSSLQQAIIINLSRVTGQRRMGGRAAAGQGEVRYSKMFYFHYFCPIDSPF